MKIQKPKPLIRKILKHKYFTLNNLMGEKSKKENTDTQKWTIDSFLRKYNLFMTTHNFSFLAKAYQALRQNEIQTTHSFNNIVAK